MSRRTPSACLFVLMSCATISLKSSHFYSPPPPLPTSAVAASSSLLYIGIISTMPPSVITLHLYIIFRLQLFVLLHLEECFRRPHSCKERRGRTSFSPFRRLSGVVSMNTCLKQFSKCYVDAPWSKD